MSTTSLQATNVSDETSLRNAITAFNSSGGNSNISFTNDISLTLPNGPLPLINPPSLTSTLTITGQNFTLTGSGVQAFTLLNGNLAISHLTIDGAYSTGTNAETTASRGGGGGGAGLGGALFVFHGTTVTVDSCIFTNNQAIGGAGSTGTGGQGGGRDGNTFYGGNGGNGGVLTSDPGDNGDGGGGNGGNGGNGGVGGSSGGGGGGGGAGGPNGPGPSSNGHNGNGGQPVSNGNGGNGGGLSPSYGWGGNGPISSTSGGGGGGGGAGGFGSGGGGGGNAVSDCEGGGGGGGGFGGGGGCGGSGTGGTFGFGTGGNGCGGFGDGSGSLATVIAGGGGGGFGGGGGGSDFGAASGGNGFGGGSGGWSGNSKGGGGAGMGGAIFVDGDLTIQTNGIFNNNSVIPGTGGAPTFNDGQALGQDIFLSSRGTLTFNIINPASVISVPHPIESDNLVGGAGNLNKMGSGTLILNGAYGLSTFGPSNIDVQAGTLTLPSGSSLISPVTVSGGVLSGAGIIHANVFVQNGGTIYPDDLNTPLTTEDLTLQPGSFIKSNISGINGVCSSINAQGFAILGNATVQISGSDSSYTIGNTYKVLTASPISQPLSSIPQILFPPGLNGVITIIANNAWFTITQVPITTTGLSGNELIIAKYLNKNWVLLGNQFQTLAGLAGDELKHALDTISPARNAYPSFVANNLSLLLSSVIQSRNNNNRVFRILDKREPTLLALDDELPEDELLAMNILRFTRDYWMNKKAVQPKKVPIPSRNISLWASGFYDFAHQDSQHQNPSFHDTSGAVIFGGDYTLKQAVVGAALAYANSSIHQDHHYGRNELNFGFLSLYGTAYLSKFFIQGAIWNGYQHTQNSRDVFFSNFSQTTKSSYSCYQGELHLGGGYSCSFPPGIVEPFIALDWAYNYQPAFTEHGASPFNMNQPHHFSSMLQTEAGLNGYYTRNFDWGYFIFRGKASYTNKAPFQMNRVSAFITGAPASFGVTALTSNLNLFSPGFEFFGRTKKGFYGSLMYNGAFGSSYYDHEAVLRLGAFF